MCVNKFATIDREMFIEDQDEDVEEEEEFHEVEEEKHKTSQESVGGGGDSVGGAGSSKVSASPKSSTKTSTSSSPRKPSPSSSKATPSRSSTTPAPLDQPDREVAVDQDQDREYKAVVDLSTGQTVPENEPESSHLHESGNVSNATSETVSNLEEVLPAAASEHIDEPHISLNEDVTSSVTQSTHEATSTSEPSAPETTQAAKTSTTELISSSEQNTVEPTSTLASNTCETNPQLPNVESQECDGIVAAMANLAVGEQSETDKAEEPPCEKEPSSEATANAEAENMSQCVKNTDWTDIMLSSNIQDSNEQTETSPVQENEADSEKKELDLDEDVKNPQYIPKKGVFYEHDDRSHDANVKKQPSTSAKKDDEAVEVKESVINKKANTQEKLSENRRGGRRPRTENDRWNHDLFRDEKQKPKSKSELINAYGYDIRHERASRTQAENRTSRGINNNNNADRQAGSQENQRQRPRDNRARRQSQTGNRSKERRPRNRQNNRNRTDTMGTPSRRDGQNAGRLNKTEAKDVRNEVMDGKQGFQASNTQPISTGPTTKRDFLPDNARNNRSDNRGRRQNSKDRPPINSVDDKLPPINTVMPPITTWSNKIEDMVKEEASRKESSPSRHQQQAMNSGAKGRSNDYWPQNQTNKSMYQDRPVRNLEDNRQQQQQPQQQYNQRRYNQDRDEASKQAQFINRNQYNDRSNQHNQEWRRTNHYNAYAKSNEYEPIKTQTFENSRLSQSTNMNRSNFRDAREIINERRMQNQQNFQPKVQPGSEQQMHPRHQQHPHPQAQHSPQAQQQHQQLVQQHHKQQLLQHHQQMLQQHQASQHIRQLPQPTQSQQQTPTSQQQQQGQNLNHQQSQPQSQPQSQQMQTQRQPQPSPQQHQSQSHQTQPRQNLGASSMADGVQEPSRLGANSAASGDMVNSRPIIKSDAYTGSTGGPLPQPIQQHSQNHRSLGGPMSQGPANSAASHLLPSHLGASGTQAQYYSPAGSVRESAAAAANAAALASAYHGYMTGAHSVMDATRYHMTSQPLSDHGYMASPGQASDVAAASVLHQQGMYTDAASTGGTVASSAYLAQAGSTLSPSSSIPVTGAGPPALPPVSYLQHSQYPPPYSNPYSQPQHNQAPPPQSSHAYPYWTYI